MVPVKGRPREGPPRIVPLTVFRKTRMHEAGQIERAVKARRVCASEHGPAHMTYERDSRDQEKDGDAT
ncbi:hypothetical protein [Streptomyces sp. G45]|uniref:hypothetical protein n=1 Tax=Streptomyces sp. G45 TaxID=3406627 RepID=UPI003C1C7675